MHSPADLSPHVRRHLAAIASDLSQQAEGIRQLKRTAPDGASDGERSELEHYALALEEARRVLDERLDAALRAREFGRELGRALYGRPL